MTTTLSCIRPRSYCYDSTTGQPQNNPNVPGVICCSSDACTLFPLTGNGQSLNCIRISDGNIVNDTLLWDGTTWIIDQLPPVPSTVITDFPITGDGTVGNPIDLVSGTASNQFLTWQTTPAGGIPSDEWVIYRSPVGIVDIIVGDPTDRRTHFPSLLLALAATPTQETRAIRVINDITETNAITLPSSFFLHVDSEVTVTFQQNVDLTGNQNFYIYGRSPQSVVVFSQSLSTNIGSSLVAEQVSLTFNGAVNLSPGSFFCMRQSLSSLSLGAPITSAATIVLEDIQIIKQASIAAGTYGISSVGELTIRKCTFNMFTDSGILINGRAFISDLTLNGLAPIIATVVVSSIAPCFFERIVLDGSYVDANGVPGTNFIFDMGSNNLANLSLDGLQYVSADPIGTKVCRLAGNLQNVQQINGANRLRILLPPGASLISAVADSIYNDTAFTGLDAHISNITGENWQVTGSDGLRFGGAGRKFLSNIRVTNTIEVKQQNIICSNLVLENATCSSLAGGDASGSSPFTNNRLIGIRTTGNFVYSPNGDQYNHFIQDVESGGNVTINTSFGWAVENIRAVGVAATITIGSQFECSVNGVEGRAVILSGVGLSQFSNILALNSLLVQNSSQSSFKGISVGGNAGASSFSIAASCSSCTFSDIVFNIRSIQNQDSIFTIAGSGCTVENVSGGVGLVPSRSFDLFLVGNSNTLNNVFMPGTISDEAQFFQVSGNRNTCNNIVLGSATAPFGRLQANTTSVVSAFIVGTLAVAGSPTGVGNLFNNIYMYPAVDIIAPTVCSTQVLIGFSGQANSAINGAFNQFNNCTFFRDSAANYGALTSQPVKVFGRNNSFQNCRIGPETELVAGFTTASFDFSTILAPVNGSIINCRYPTANTTTNGAILNIDQFFTY